MIYRNIYINIKVHKTDVEDVVSVVEDDGSVELVVTCTCVEVVASRVENVVSCVAVEGSVDLVVAVIEVVYLVDVFVVYVEVTVPVVELAIVVVEVPISKGNLELEYKQHKTWFCYIFFFIQLLNAYT